MFAKIAIIAASCIAAVHACTGASQLAANPVTAPTLTNGPVIGQAFTIEWGNYTNQGATVTLSLYNGCPNNCKEVTDIVGGTKNTGSYSWTPSNTLKPGSDYGILFINEEPCLTSWAYFTLNAEGTVVSSGNPGPSSTGTSTSAHGSVPLRTMTTTVYATSYAYVSTSSSIKSSSSSFSKSAGSTVTVLVGSGKPSSYSTAPGSTSKTGPATATASLSQNGGVSTGPAQSLSIGILCGVIAILVSLVL